MDLLREGSKKIFIHPHHRNNGDPENDPHVHVEDTSGRNSYSLIDGRRLQSSRSIDKKTEKWFENNFYYYNYEWMNKWNATYVDWKKTLDLDIENTKTLIKK